MTSPLTAVSLFAGVGGFDLALERAGVTVAASVEIDDHARGVLAHRFPNSTLFSDVRKVSVNELRTAGYVPERGILVGGFPCQDLSVAGKRSGLAGQRSGLFWEIVRLIDEAPPKYVVLENVPGLLSSNGGRDMGVVLSALVERGYGVAYRILDAQYFGVAQRRRRVFIVGCLGDSGERSAEILSLIEGMRGDPATRRTSKQDDSATVEGGIGVGSDLNDVVVGPLTTGITAPRGTETSDSRHLVVFEDRRRDAPAIRDTVVGSLQAFMGTGGNNVPMAAYSLEPGAAQRTDVDRYWKEMSPTLRANAGDNQPAVAHAIPIQGSLIGRSDSAGPQGSGTGDPDGPMFTLNTTDRHAVAFDAYGSRFSSGSVSGTLRGSDGGAAVAVTENQRAELLETPVMGSLTTSGGKPGQGYPAVRVGYVVRRLTPMECERLQGFPDEWTAWYQNTNGVAVAQADTHRYKQMGNAVAVPVVEWIIRRLVASELR